jgi:short-subunit dehydrogenase
MVSSSKAAADIAKAIQRRRDVIYTAFFWRYIMLIIRSIPEWLFKRLKL